MSGYAGELFVRIVPDAQGFDRELDQQLSRQAQNVPTQASQQNTTRQSAQAISDLEKRADAARAAVLATAAASQRASAEFLVGAGSEEAAAAAGAAFTAAQQAAAKANVELALSSGQAAAATDLLVLAEGRAATEGARHAQRFRQQARLVAEGEAPLSSLFGPASLARFGAGALAFGAVITTLGHLEEGLKTTGDEAFTTEGRLRNLAAAGLRGDLVEAFHAINDQAESATTELSKMREEGKATADEYVIFGDKASGSAAHLRELVAAQEELGHGNAFATQALRAQAAELEKAGNQARDYAAGMIAADQATQGFQATVRSAGSEAAAFGERVRGAGDVAANTPLRPRGAAGITTESDSTATLENQRAIEDARVARTKSLSDDLALAQRRLQDEQTKAANLAAAGVVEGARERQRIIEEARTEVRNIEQQIAAQAAAAAEQDAANQKAIQDAQVARTTSLNDDLALAQSRERDARLKQARLQAAGSVAAAREQQRIAEEAATQVANIQRQISAQAQSDYEDQISLQDKRLSLAAEAADHAGRAERQYQAFLKRESADSRLTAAAQLGYAEQLGQERAQVRAAIAAAAKAQIDLQNEILNTQLSAAQLTDTTADDERVYRRQIRALDADIRRQRALAKKVGEHTAEGLAALTEVQKDKQKQNAIRLAIKNLNQQDQGGTSFLDLLNAAQEEFRQSASNVSPSPISGGQIRQAIAGGVIANSDKLTMADRAKLAAASETNGLLAQILTAVQTGPRTEVPQVRTPNNITNPYGYRTARNTREFAGLEAAN